MSPESTQGLLDLFAPDVHPVSDGWGEPAPIAPSADLTAKHCSSMGALKIVQSREGLWRQMLECYDQEPFTDAELAMMLRVAPSTVSARRSELIKRGLVDPQSCGTRKNPTTGISNSLWQLRKDA